MARRRFDDDDDFDDEDDRPRRRRRDEDEDDDDRPRRRPKKPTGSNGMAVTSLVLGILSFFCTPLVGIPAMVCGALGIMKANTVGVGKGMAIAGLSLGLAGTIVSSIWMYATYRAVVAVKKGVEEIGDKVKTVADHGQTMNNMKQVSMAGINHNDQFNQYPRSYLMPENGKNPPANVNDRLSWRVAMLPHMNQNLVYRRFKTDEAWNSPANRPAADSFVMQYADAGSTGPQTRYRVFVGGGAMFDADPPYSGPLPRPLGSYAKNTKLLSATDGTSNTIFCVEATETVPWAQHNEFAFNPNGSLPSFGKPAADMYAVAMCDGSVRTVRKTVNPKVIKEAITRAGGEVVSLDW